MPTSNLIETIDAITNAETADCDLKRENGNINGDSAMGIMLRYGSEVSKDYVLRNVIPENISKAHDEGYIHIHDLDFYLLTTTCCQIDLSKLFTRGFNTGHGYLREPQSITTAAALACIAIQSNQNDQHGGQSIPAFDFMLAPYVKKSYLKHYRKARELSYLFTADDNDSTCAQIAWKNTEQETEQAMEAVIHNLNTMHCLPASETVWVFDHIDGETKYMTFVELYDAFDPDRYSVISVDPTTGHLSYNKITAIKESGSHRKGNTIINELGRRVTTTDNHKIMGYEPRRGGIVEKYPRYVKNTIVPVQTSNPTNHPCELSLRPFTSRKKQNYTKRVIPVTPSFAMLLGMYVADGSVVGGSQLCFSVCNTEKDAVLIDIMEEAYPNVTWKTATYGEDMPKDVRFNVGKVWTDAFRHYCGDGAKNKKVPHQMFTADLDIVREFLYGYFWCDGMLTDSKGISASSISKELRDGIGLLISRFGETAYYTQRNSQANLLSDNMLYEISVGSLSARVINPRFATTATREYPHWKTRIRDVAVVDVRSNDEVVIEEMTYDIEVENDHTFMTGEGIIVHNSRAGAQVPFSSINYGTDTSREGRLVTRSILKATEQGMGLHETPIFPVQIFKCKHGVNLDEGDPNYDLFQYSLYVTGLRMYPNYSFMDTTFNKPTMVDGRPETEVAYMGCRTRVMADQFGEAQAYGRGNLSFTTINLPRLALENIKQDPDMQEGLFMQALKDMVDLVAQQLLHRYDFLCRNKHKPNFPFLFGSGVWMGSENLSDEDNIHEVLKHGTLSIGFIGLAECVKVLTGHYPIEDKYAHDLGLNIVSLMRAWCDLWAERAKMNFTLLATPAEGTAGKFVLKDRAKYGIIEGVTDRDYYTNSFHAPVWYECTIAEKLAHEGEYHKFCNAGHISYVEVDGDVSKNTKALESIVKYADECDCGYFAINHPIDYCPVCGFTGIIDDTCPKCGRKDNEAPPEVLPSGERNPYYV